jgi:hypothetical protein
VNYPAVYLSGAFDLTHDMQLELLKRTGSRHRCFSFAFLLPENIHYNKKMVECLKACESKDVNIMLDSGAYSLHAISRASSTRGTKAATKHALSIEELQTQLYKGYVGYVKDKLKKKAFGKEGFFITLDFIKHQPTIFAMQKKFLKDGLDPTPVYHGDSPLDWIKKYMDLGHKFICIGSIKRAKGSREYFSYYDKVFDFGEKHGLKYHGLGGTSMDFMFNWPWLSVDSTTWTLAASYGCLLMPPSVHRGTFDMVHVSNKLTNSKVSYRQLPLASRKVLDDYVSGFGFKMKELRKSTFEREVWNAYVFSNLKKMVGEGIPDRGRWENLL